MTVKAAEREAVNALSSDRIYYCSQAIFLLIFLLSTLLSRVFEDYLVAVFGNGAVILKHNLSVFGSADFELSCVYRVSVYGFALIVIIRIDLCILARSSDGRRRILGT